MKYGSAAAYQTLGAGDLVFNQGGLNSEWAYAVINAR